MRRSDDLTEMLRRWEYDENRPVRRLKAGDGREVLQVRLPLGIEQYEINGRPDGKRLEEGMEAIRRLPAIEENPVFDFERERSIKSIQDLIRQFRNQLPVSKRDLLKKEMDEAIKREDYERAATLRDQLRRLTPRRG